MKAKLFVIGLFLFALAACTQRAKVPESVEGPSLVYLNPCEMSVGIAWTDASASTMTKGFARALDTGHLQAAISIEKRRLDVKGHKNPIQ